MIKALHSLCLLALCVTFTHAIAQEATRVTTFFPRPSDRPGGTTSYGSTEVAESEPNAMITASNSKDVGIVLWFAQHRPLPASEVEGWSNEHLQIEIRTTADALTPTISAAWRGTVNPAELGVPVKVKDATITTEWTKVAIPIPSTEGLASTSITGLLFTLSPGAYEIRSVEVVSGN